MSRRPWNLALCLGLLSPAVAVRAAEPAPAGNAIVELPPFVITENRAGKPWRFGEAEGFEIISQVDDATTQQVFAALWRGPRLTLPPELHPRLSTPTAVIIFNQDPDRGVGSLDSLRQTHEQGSHWTNVIKRTLPDREIFSVNLRGRSFFYSSTFRFDLRTLLALPTPPAPPWLHEALYGAYGIYREGIEYPDRGKATGIVRGLWCRESEYARAAALAQAAEAHFLTAPAKRRAAPAPLQPYVADLATLWEGGWAGDPRPPEESARWAATCALFARWALYAEEGRYHDAFWKFAVKTCRQPVDETLFRECFGLGFAEARAEASWFLPLAISETASRPIKPLLVPKVAFRPATVTEVARVRGDFERHEATLLAARFPEIAAKYSAKAGHTLRTAHAADPNDPRLAETLGLYEFETGNTPRALELLTAATATGHARPRAWFTLAHLRLLDFGRTTAGAKPPLSHAQALEVLLPLERAFAAEPAMAVSYELLAELWRRCPDLTADEVVPQLLQGQERFPRLTRLTLAALRACLERGQRDPALVLLERALPFTTEPALRARLEQTRAALLQARRQE